MGNWEYTVNIAGPLARWEDTGTVATAEAIYTALTTGLPEDLADNLTVWEFDAIAVDYATPTDTDLQEALDDLFDWADRERVWVECYRAETPEATA